MFMSLHPLEKKLDPAFVRMVVERGGVQGVEWEVVTNLHANFGTFVQSHRVFIKFFKI